MLPKGTLNRGSTVAIRKKCAFCDGAKCINCICPSTDVTVLSTQLSSINRFFILTHYMFQPYFWGIFRWYICLNAHRLDHHAIHFNRT